MTNRIVRLVLYAISCSCMVFADQVTLKNGDRISGKITQSDEKSLLIKTEYAGDVKIDRASIVSVTSDGPLNVQLADKTVVGTVAAEPDRAVSIRPSEGPAVSAPIDQVVAFRNEDAQKAYLREVERVQNPRLNDFWTGFVSFNLAGASGNAQTSSISTSAAASRSAGKNKMSLNFTQVYASQSNTEPTGATANRISGGYRIDRDISKRMFVFGTADFDYDRFLDLDLRSVLGGGLGYHAWKAENGFLDLGAGGVWNREKFGDGVLRNSSELLINQEFGYKIFNRLKLSERVSFYPNLSNTGEYRLNFDTGLSMPVFKWLEWNLGISNRYLSNPPVGRRSNDLLYTTGIRFSFDQTKR